MPNSATISASAGIYTLKVNNISIMSSSDSARITAIKNRLNYIFNDTDRDLDFITPSYANGCYVVCCPLVRKNQNYKTYRYDTTAHPENNYYDEKLYEDTNWNDTRVSSIQSAILTVLETSKPWYWALYYSNKIRSAITLNFNDALGHSTCQKLIMPTNQGTTKTLINAATQFTEYGHICQGTSPGMTSSCSCGTNFYVNPQNTLNLGTSNGEVFHPQDLTAAIQTGPSPQATNGWYTLYKNKFIKITNVSDSNKSIVVKITDRGTSNSGIEVSDRVYRELGFPAPMSNSVKIELLGD